jgi:hypothetical protein
MPMVVYDGDERTVLGEIEDHGSEVLAFVYSGDTRRIQIGFFADRRSAMRAVSDLAKATK